MSVRIEKLGTRTVTLRWSQDDDPRNRIYEALTGDAPLLGALQAIGDAMEFANTDQLADADDAKQRLRAVLATIALLNDRADVLTVALKDTYKLSWSELQEVIDPENPQARSTARRRYDAGRKRTGIPAPAAVQDTPGSLRSGQRVRVVVVPDHLSPHYIGCEGVIQEFNAIENSYILTGLSRRPHTEQVFGIAGFQDDHIEALDDDQDAGEKSS